MATRKPAAAPPGRALDDLGRVLEMEARLEERVRRAEMERQQLVVEARGRAAAATTRLGAEIEEAMQRLAAEIAGERARREQEIQRTTAREVARFEGVGEERIAELAADVVARVIGVPGPP